MSAGAVDQDQLELELVVTFRRVRNGTRLTAPTPAALRIRTLMQPEEAELFTRTLEQLLEPPARVLRV